MCPTVQFYWDGFQQEIASAVSYQKTPVAARVPAGATPGRHYVRGMSCYAAEVPFDVVSPTTSPLPPLPVPTTTVVVPPVPRPTTQPTTVKPTGGPAATPAQPLPTTSGQADTTAVTTTDPAAEGGEPTAATISTGGAAQLVFDKPSVQAGEPLSATGTGCDPLATVDLTSGGERVGAAVADATGGFTTPVELSRVVPGRHVVTASCGVLLTGAVDVVLTSSTSGNTGTLAVLVFFVLAALTLVARPRGHRTR